MTKEEEKRQLVVLKTADALEGMRKTEGWKYLESYLSVRVGGLKNELTKINLDKELSKASKIQGKIEALNSIFSRVSNVLKEAEAIRRRKEEK